MRPHPSPIPVKSRRPTLGRRSAVLALLLAALACACGGTDSASSSTGTGAKRLPPLRAGEHQDGRTLTLRRGQHLVVVLHSTYWEFAPSSNPGVLRAAGAPKTVPHPSGCVPGEGCGTVTAVYVARRRGAAVVAASRTSCGEALRCSADAGSYVLHVRVR